IQTLKVVKGEEQEKGFEEEYVISMVFLFLLYMTLILYGQTIMRSIIEEKTSRIVEVLLSSANSFQLLMGKLLGVGSVGLVQYVLWSVLASVGFIIGTASVPNLSDVFSISPMIMFYFILFFIIGYFTFSTLYAAAASLSSDMQDMQSLSMIVTILVIIPFVVSFAIVRNPTSDLSQVLSFIPFFTPLLMFMRISLVTPPLWEILLAIGINLVTIVGIIWLSARIFRIGILMTGKRPTLPEVIRWVRYR
ncbi:MAG: ABC transporter permease, partial [Calditrichia bacterium]